MSSILLNIWLLAQEGAANGGAAEGANGEAANGAVNGGGLGSMWGIFIPFLVILILFQLLISRPQARERARREEMLKALKKNDPVITIGGIIGTVVSMAEDGSEVTVRVDDNTRLKLRRDAIREVIAKEEKPKEESK